MIVYQYYHKTHHKCFYHVDEHKLNDYEVGAIEVPPHLWSDATYLFSGDVTARQKAFEANIKTVSTPRFIKYVNFLNGCILREIKQRIKTMHNNFETFTYWAGSISNDEVEWLQDEIKYIRFIYRFGYLYIYV